MRVELLETRPRAEVVAFAAVLARRAALAGSISMPQDGSTTRVADHEVSAALSSLSESRRNCPETTTRSPGDTPSTISTRSCARHPVRTGRGSRRPPPRSTNTTCRCPESMTASRSTTTVSGSASSTSTSSSISGRSSARRLSTSSRTLKVRAPGSNCPGTAPTRARMRVCPGSPTSAVVPGRRKPMSWERRRRAPRRGRGRQCGRARRTRRSAAPWSALRASTIPETGETSSSSEAGVRVRASSRICRPLMPMASSPCRAWASCDSTSVRCCSPAAFALISSSDSRA